MTDDPLSDLIERLYQEIREKDLMIMKLNCMLIEVSDDLEEANYRRKLAEDSQIYGY